MITALGPARRPLTGLFALLLASVLAPAAAQSYRLVDLGADVAPEGINNQGTVVGERKKADGTYQAIRYFIATGVMQDIIGGVRAYAINAVDQIDGDPQPLTGAFLYSNNVLQNLGTNYRAFGINDGSQLAGSSAKPNPYRASPRPTNPAIFDATSASWRVLDIAKVYPRGTRQGVYADIYTLLDINDAGYAVGKYYRAGLSGSAAILTTPTFDGVVTIPLPYGGYASAINNQNKVACTSGSYSTVAYAHAFLYDYGSGERIDLGTLNGGLTSSAADINNLNQVVGSAWLATALTSAYDPASYHAFIWENGVMTDLNTPITASAGWILTAAKTINDRGDIAGTGLLAGQVHGFVLLVGP